MHCHTFNPKTIALRCWRQVPYLARCRKSSGTNMGGFKVFSLEVAIFADTTGFGFQAARTWQAFGALCISSICVFSLHIQHSVRYGLPKSAQENITDRRGIMGKQVRTFVKTTSTIYIIFAAGASIFRIFITDACLGV